MPSWIKSRISRTSDLVVVSPMEVAVECTSSLRLIIGNRYFFCSKCVLLEITTDSVSQLSHSERTFDYFSIEIVRCNGASPMQISVWLVRRLALSNDCSNKYIFQFTNISSTMYHVPCISCVSCAQLFSAVSAPVWASAQSRSWGPVSTART